MIQTQLFTPRPFVLRLERKVIKVTEANFAELSKKFTALDGTDNEVWEMYAKEEDLKKFPSKVQEHFRIQLDENLKLVKGISSELRYTMEIDAQINEFINDMDLKESDIIDVKFSIALSGEYDIQSALLIYRDENP